MFRLLARYKRGVLIALLASMPAVMLFAQTRHPASRGPVVGLVIDVASVVERFLLAGTGWVSDLLTTYVTSVNAVDELSALRRQERFVVGLQAELDELRLENERLRKLSNLASGIDGPQPLGANIIGRSGAPLSRVARIDRGRRDGVRRGDTVVSARGVVGRVLTAGFVASDVLLLTDPTSSIDVVVQRTRVRGLVRGFGDDGRYRAQVEDFDRLADVQPGDVLLTSGLDKRTPQGLFVGVVEVVEEREDRLYRRAEVRPGAPLATVEQVLVLVGRAQERRPMLQAEPPTDVDPQANKPPPVEGGPSEGDTPSSSTTRPPAPRPAPARPAPAPAPPPSNPSSSSTPSAGASTSSSTTPPAAGATP